MSSPPLVQVFALCEALYEDTHVASLDLSYNNLNDTAAQALSRLIKVRGRWGKGVQGWGAQAQAEALSRLIKLRGLWWGGVASSGGGSVPPH